MRSFVLAATLLFASLTRGGMPLVTKSDLDLRDQWVHAHFEQGSQPFTLQYVGQPFTLPANPAVLESIAQDGSRTTQRAIWRDPKSHLTLIRHSVTYRDYPVVEWTLFVRNDGEADSAIVSDLRPLDLEFTMTGDVTLHHNVGSPCTPTDYRPLADPLIPGQFKTMSAAGGRPTSSDLPFFNLSGPSQGTIVALGWPAQWSATITRTNGDAHVVAAQEKTHFKLLPGEQVRTPLVALLFYAGNDTIRAQNLWRRWMIAYNLPRDSRGNLPKPMTAACSSHQLHEMINADEANQKQFIEGYLSHGIKLDYWWMDAGWYVNNGDWPNTGTWTVDPKRFPNGLRSITNFARLRAVKSLLWFEPERVTPGTELYTQHPQWLLGKDGEQKLLNLGIEEARKWWIDHADKLMTDQGIDLYRTDFNIDPLPYWRGNDAEDRQGITENRYVTGFLAYLDELRKRHPDMWIDTCASGGRRNDLETLRRAIPLLRSDFLFEPTSQQNHTYGIASWIPYYGTGVNSSDPYPYRSVSCPWQTMCYDTRRADLDYPAIVNLWTQWKSYADCLLGDFYPLTPYSPDNTAWIAWQFDLPDKSRGVIQAFRRQDAASADLTLKLQGLVTTATYELQDVDDKKPTTLTGQQLMTIGLPLRRDAKPAAVTITYRKL